jgi:ribosome recycling factor
MPLNQMANKHAGTKLMMINPWIKGLFGDIEKSILTKENQSRPFERRISGKGLMIAVSAADSQSAGRAEEDNEADNENGSSYHTVRRQVTRSWDKKKKKVDNRG